MFLYINMCIIPWDFTILDCQLLLFTNKTNKTNQLSLQCYTVSKNKICCVLNHNDVTQYIMMKLKPAHLLHLI